MKFESDLIGHQLPQKILCQAILTQKFGHAYLFSGEEGIGKRTVALAVAKTLLCQTRVPFCGECPSCQKARQKTHPDLFEISPDGAFIKLSQVRQIQEQMVLHPVFGLKKVFIIDGADRMNPEAANAFLKSLEEPPPHTHFILITSRPQAILSTIFSRCQQIRFATPPRDELIDFLVKKKGLTALDARNLAKRTQGKVGLALSIDIESLNRDDLNYFRLIEKETLASPSRLFQLSEELSRDSDHFRKTVEWILFFLRDAIIWKNCPDPEFLILDRHWEMINDSASRFSTQELHRSFELTQEIEKLIQRNINRPLALETVLLKLKPHPEQRNYELSLKND
ncbi:MAG: DNA polymerase III subunit delta' [Nitrospiria bacterium]